ncbi:MAG TPA: DNA-formamidopyrimidine glycosylase family protein [Planctomycetota bacterium]|nr:DNA-formamidopyrimidine glycosylase family protein [Planctomycetota bacterium]
MPELPDVTIYQERLVALLRGEVLEQTRLFSPFVLRSVEPPITALHGRALRGVERLGKRLVFDFGDDLFLVVHLMIAGRLRWRKKGSKPPGRLGLAAFDFAPGTVMLTEAATRKRASLHVVPGRAALAEFDRGGLEVLDSTLAEFAAALRRENRTLKRALTDPRILSGIGNAYSDEILHAAGLSPVQLTSRLDDEAMARLHAATVATLRHWIDRLRAEVGDGFPEQVTAFREGMAVHGRYRQPCPRCGTPVQHIRYASNECNYCPACQTGGRLLADRGLSQLMRADWPKTLEELEERKRG